MNQHEKHGNEDTRPFAAPCRRLAAGAPLRWLGCGWRDYTASPRVSLAYGLIVFAVSLGVSLLAWKLGSYVLVISMLSGFIFIAPLLATGLYSVSRQIGREKPVSFARSVKRMQFALRDALVFALVLLVIFLVWVRAGVMVHVFFPAGESHDLLLLLRFLGIGSAVGSIFALVTFSAAAFSLPMIVDRDADMVTACITSVNAVLRNKPAMAIWVALIVLLTGLGFATAGLGLIVVIPLLGYATWHGYVETIDASAWPDSAS
ncbi:MAG TPA: DUF2189 domain-containing protein [Wenzhouxiangellaceae bacterium]|nr:DUF2189 domain-containing protein [Wenzhouxiangellaceae bacterium]